MIPQTSLTAPPNTGEDDLRPYQHDLLRRVQAALRDDDKARVMVQLPTGGGKTVIAGMLLADWLEPGRKCVWLTHRKELVSQSSESLRNRGVRARADARWAPGTHAPAVHGGVVILMAQTVSRRNVIDHIWGAYEDTDLLIIDEATTPPPLGGNARSNNGRVR